MFVKDPETGKRTPMARPQDDWVVDDRPDLAIIDHALWARVQERLQTVRADFNVTPQQRRPHGKAPHVYSPHLLSGLIRCALGGARITVQTSQRKKRGVVYRYGRYRCSFHITKGPAVCGNSMSIRQPILEASLLDTLRAALTPAMIDDLVTTTNQLLHGLHGATPRELTTLTDERQAVERQLSNLVAFVANGDLASPRLRDEIRAREERLVQLDRQLDRLRAAVTPEPRQIDRAWVEKRLQSFTELLATDPAGARREIQKHVEDLRVVPTPELGERAVRITGRAKVFPGTGPFPGPEEGLRGPESAKPYTSRHCNLLK